MWLAELVRNNKVVFGLHWMKFKARTAPEHDKEI
jgi:hypothetical protein